MAQDSMVLLVAFYSGHPLSHHAVKRESLTTLGIAGKSPFLGHKVEHLKVQQMCNVPSKKGYERVCRQFIFTECTREQTTGDIFCGQPEAIKGLVSGTHPCVWKGS